MHGLDLHLIIGNSGEVLKINCASSVVPELVLASETPLWSHKKISRPIPDFGTGSFFCVKFT